MLVILVREAIGATLEGCVFSYCRFCRRAKSLSHLSKWMVGRGGGDRTLYPLNTQCFQRLAMKGGKTPFYTFFHPKRLGPTKAGDCRRASLATTQ